VLAKTAIDRMAAGATPARAGRAALKALRRVDGRAGLILVDRKGRVAAVFNTPRMARGLATERGGLRVRVDGPAGRP
jgi:isoaspartyl peptidase/L-asparaginase-like protein (Ntn-hydrolase superfamily)